MTRKIKQVKSERNVILFVIIYILSSALPRRVLGLVWTN